MPNVQWNRGLAAHLLRRAGFGATPEELDRYTQMGLEGAVNTLVNFESVSNAALDTILATYNFNFDRGPQVQLWWLVRMLYTARPLEEKMTFFWHNHFATSIQKVNSLPMKAQNELFRRFALGNFRDMLVEVSKDPAMLDWLDNRTNRVGRPNENYARELMELFTMGIGNYTEDDIHEIARCFTGWTIRDDAFFFAAGFHDNGAKSFLGTSVASGGGMTDGERVCDVIAANPATSKYMARRLFEAFVYTNPSDATVNKYAGIYTSSGYSIREVMKQILLSDEFYSDKALYATVKSPTEYVIGSLKALSATVDTRVLAQSTGSMGQVLLAPPDVGGWDGGLEWINTSTILARDNYSNALVTNRPTGGNQRGNSIDTAKLLGSKTFTKTGKLVDYFLELLGPLTVDEATRKSLSNYLKYDDAGQKVKFKLDDATTDKKVRGLIHLIMTLPEYQMN